LDLNLVLVQHNAVGRSWNTCVKLARRISRSSHNYFVEHLASDLPVRKKLLFQYVSFFQNLSKSKSREVRILCHIVSHDIQSTSGRNLANIKVLFNLDPKRDHPAQFRKLLDQRRDMYTCEEDTKTVDELIESLCAS
jgi:hypothetical protein